MVKRQSKLDLIAAAAIAVMFLGAFILTLSVLGLVLIAAGIAVMLLLFWNTRREEQ